MCGFVAEQANTIDVQLEIGGATETVNVAAAAPLLIPRPRTSPAPSLPSRSRRCPRRDATRFSCCSSRLARSATGARRPAAARRICLGRRSAAPSNVDGVFTTENGGQISANGARTGENNYQIDGVGVTSVSWGGTTVITPNEDSIKEIKVVTNNYDAENGRYRGAQVQIISQNGTNELHGSAFFKRVTARAERLPAVQRLRDAVERNTAQFNDIGGTAGGPIFRNKLFGFFSYETIRNSQSAIDSGLVPDAAVHGDRRPAGSVAERYLTFPGSAPAAGTVLMGAGDCHSAGTSALSTASTVGSSKDKAWTRQAARARSVSVRQSRSVACDRLHARPWRRWHQQPGQSGRRSGYAVARQYQPDQEQGRAIQRAASTFNVT